MNKCYVTITLTKDETSPFWDYTTTVSESLNLNVTVDRNRLTRYVSSDEAYQAAKKNLNNHVVDHLYEKEQEANDLLLSRG